jgi:hypothetical protein
MFYIRTVILLFLFSISFIGCGEDEDIMNLTIASKVIPNTTFGVCFIVKYENEQEWSLFYSLIEGFDYREGYECVINVTATPVKSPMQDASSKAYKLNYIISCEEKESEGILFLNLRNR